MVVLFPNDFLQILELQYTCVTKLQLMCVVKTSVQILVLERMNSKDKTKISYLTLEVSDFVDFVSSFSFLLFQG